MVGQFLDYLQYELRRSPLTIKSYSEDLKAFEDFFKGCDDQLTWESVDSDVIRAWMESMMDKGNNASSVNRRLSALRSLYRFALAHHLVEKDPAHGIDGPKKQTVLPYFLKESEMDRLLDQIEWGKGYKDVLTRSVVVTFYSTGVRLAELIGLQDSMVDFDNRQLKVTGKGNKQRIIPFGEELEHTLKTYMSMRDQELSVRADALFLSDKGERLRPEQVRNLVKAALAQVSTLKKLSPHVLRHTFATSMLNHGAGIESVRRLLGHESVSTTEIYTHTTFEQLKRVYDEAHPRA